MDQNGTHELHKKLFDLTYALYRVTDRMPEQEVLREKLREKALNFMSAVIEHDRKDTRPLFFSMAAVIKEYLEISYRMGLMRLVNKTVLEREYDNLAKALSFLNEPVQEKAHGFPIFLRKKISEEGKKIENSVVPAGEINERQKALLNQLSKTGQGKIGDFHSFFDGISSKTIQRDLQDLIMRNLVKKEGEKRWTTYFFNNV